MSKVRNVVIGGLAIAAVYKGTQALRKLSKLADNIYVSASPTKFSFANLTTVNVLFDVALKNISGINLSIKNLYSRFYLVTKDGNKLEAGLSKRVNALSFKDNEVKNFQMDFNFSYLLLIGKILTGKIKSFQLVSYYDFKGQTLQYTTDIPYAEFIQMAKDFVSGKKAVQGVGNIGLL